MKVIGIMSGSSMDGTDLALCNVQSNGSSWTANIEVAKTYPMDEKWRIRLSQLKYQSSQVFSKTDVFYGRYLGELVNDFLTENQITAHALASHGHTIFHDPSGWLTTQIGDGATLSATCNLPVVSNFRRADVALGGQGAPLAGIGDSYLYNNYDACLNLGGFCNISAINGNSRTAWDISPCNIVLNRIAREMGEQYDAFGSLSQQGEIDFKLLEKLNEIPYYHINGAKSLGREWINQNFWHIVRDFDKIPSTNKLKTLIVHIAFQVARSIDATFGNNGANKTVLVSGGGVFNTTLMEFLAEESDAKFEIPDTNIIHFKEAQIFALLASLRIQNIKNTDAVQTGAKYAVVAGSLDGDFSNLLK